MSEKVRSTLIVGITFLALILFSIFTHDKFQNSHGHDHYFLQDVDQYYSYLPAYFIHNDLDFQFENQYWLIEAENGRKVPKVTMGMALMYCPFFLVADNIAKVNDDYARDGYSLPYVQWVRFGSVLYFFLGLLFLALALLKFFKPHIVAITCALIFLGTNLLYYTLGHAEYPHAYLFALFSLIIYLSIQWYEKRKWQHILLLGLVAGLAALIRPTAVFILLVPLLYGVSGLKTVRHKLEFLWSERWKIIAAGVFFFIPLILQFLFWKEHTGQYLFYSYGSDERFFFGNPHVTEFLIGYRKGWFIYTPIILLAVAGLFFFREKAKNLRVAVPVILVLTVYVFSSWWAWWYGGSFGMRAMVQYYALMAFPLAAILAYAFKRWFVVIPVICIGIFCINLNLKQSRQYKGSQIHWDGMTREAYWYLIEHPKFAPADWEEFESLIKRPDYDAAKLGKDS